MRICVVCFKMPISCIHSLVLSRHFVKVNTRQVQRSKTWLRMGLGGGEVGPFFWEKKSPLLLGTIFVLKALFRLPSFARFFSLHFPSAGYYMLIDHQLRPFPRSRIKLSVPNAIGLRWIIKIIFVLVRPVTISSSSLDSEYTYSTLPLS